MKARSPSDRATGVQPRYPGVRLIASPAAMPSVALSVALEERPAAPIGVPACTERLPRDVLVRLIALSRRVTDIRQNHDGCPELSPHLDRVVTSLDDLIQSIYDETAWHLAGRAGDVLPAGQGA